MIAAVCAAEGRLEGNKMIVKVMAGIDLSLLKLEMRIQALLLWTTARKVFGHTGHASRAQRFPLQSFNVSFRQTSCKMGILSKRAANAWPARFGCQINLRMEGDANTYCEVFFSDSICKLPYQFNITDRPKTQGFAPLRKIERRHRKDIV